MRGREASHYLADCRNVTGYDAMNDDSLLKDRKLIALGAASLLSSAIMLALLFTDGGFR